MPQINLTRNRVEAMVAKAAGRIIKIENEQTTLQMHPVERGLYDVFQGEGWAKHSRYRHNKGRWFHVSGLVLNPALLPSIS